jgi:CBS domain-containing protein
MQARDVMMRRVISVAADDTILNAAQAMLQKGISGLLVTDTAGNLVGIVTEGDFLRRGGALQASRAASTARNRSDRN